jgi:hypothetical protein
LFKFYIVQILIVRGEKIIDVLYNFFNIKLKIKLIHFFLYKLPFYLTKPFLQILGIMKGHLSNLRSPILLYILAREVHSKTLETETRAVACDFGCGGE